MSDTADRSVSRAAQIKALAEAIPPERRASMWGMTLEQIAERDLAYQEQDEAPTMPAVDPMVWIGSGCGYVEPAIGMAAGYYAGDTEPCVHCSNRECVATLTAPPPGWLDRMLSAARGRSASLAAVDPMTMSAGREYTDRCIAHRKHGETIHSDPLRRAHAEIDALRAQVAAGARAMRTACALSDEHLDAVDRRRAVIAAAEAMRIDAERMGIECPDIGIDDGPPCRNCSACSATDSVLAYDAARAALVSP